MHAHTFNMQDVAQITAAPGNRLNIIFVNGSSVVAMFIQFNHAANSAVYFTLGNY